MTSIDADVVIVGAGLSGIGLACRLQQWSPSKKVIILESKTSLGGTWELFKYPGIRSDSDLHTFGFPFRPWSKADSIAQGDDILQYLKDTANEYGVDKNILFEHKVVAAAWSTPLKAWDLTISTPRGENHLKASFIMYCTGYYDHDTPFASAIPGIENFKGTVVHPQTWPNDLDYKDKHVVIIGSGATTVTLLPALKEASRVTQLQRSPSYIVSQTQDDPLNKLLRYALPRSWSAKLIRAKYILLSWMFYAWATTFPSLARKLIRAGAASSLPKDYVMDPHFVPTYDPWSQRLCLCPDGDYFAALSAGKGQIVTGKIATVTSDSILLQDTHEKLKPDIIVTATGLRLMIAGGVNISVDGKPLKVSDKYMYRGVMLQDVPNTAFVIGYVNASWTLGLEVTAHFLSRLFRHMSNKQLHVCTPRLDADAVLHDRPVMGLSSTYVVTQKSILPKAAAEKPWRPRTMYYRDLLDAKMASFADLHFTS